MSSIQALVSLLDSDDSDRLLRDVHRLLRPADAERVALLRPPDPELGLGILREAHPALAVVMTRGRALAVVDAARVSDRVYVWCSDDAEAEALPGDRGCPVVAADLEELAWELVRRLTGDLRDGGGVTPQSADGDAGPGSTSAAENAANAPAPPAAPGGGAARMRQARVPPPPHWARVTGVLPAHTDASPAVVAHPQRNPAGSSPEITAPENRTPEPVVSAPTSPLSALSAAGPVPAQPTARGTNVVARRRPGRPGIAGLRELVSRMTGAADPWVGPDVSALGQALLRMHSTVVAVGTPKGGPGKTTEAAAIAVLGARAVEPLGGSAVLVDANLNNPDAWRQLAVPADAITVREVVEALNRGALVPNGEYARSERLRVLPERRQGGKGYTAAEIVLLDDHLRLRHTLIVVDLANSLPNPAGSDTEVLVAHWLSHADVVVLPLDLGEASFVAVGEMLDAVEGMVAESEGRLHPPGLVVPLLLPRDGRRALALPALADSLEYLRGLGAAVVEVPLTVDVQTASQRRRSIVGASARADRAFAGVLRAVVAARPAGDPRVRHG